MAHGFAWICKRQREREERERVIDRGSLRIRFLPTLVTAFLVTAFLVTAAASAKGDQGRSA